MVSEWGKGATRKYSFPDLVNSIDRLAQDLGLRTTHGLYLLRGDKLTQLRFEPDVSGRYVMLAGEVR